MDRAADREASHPSDARAERESVRMLRLLLSNLPGMAYRCPNEPSWPMEFVSEGCRQLTGHTAKELTRGGTVEYGDLIVPEDRGGVWQGVQEALESGEAFLLEYRIRSADGTLKWVWERGAAVAGPDGRVEALEGFIMDISERHEAQERLRSAERLESVGRLAGGVAHDFNNVLTVVTALTDLIGQTRADDEDLVRDLGRIRDAALRAGSLTRQLLAFSRRQALSPKLLDLNEVVAGMQTMLPPLLGSGIELRLRLGSELGPIRADRSQFEQVLMNLVVNARDAMPGGGQLTVQTDIVTLEPVPAEEAGLDPGPWLRLTVQDTGTGMDEATRQRIFEPFFTTKNPEQGTGLGLATVHGIVSQTGGGLRVRTALEAGTTFEVLLPRVTRTPEVGRADVEQQDEEEISELLDRIRNRLDRRAPSSRA